MRELVLLADFGEPFFPIAFVRERVTAPSTADPHGVFLQRGIQRNFATGEETVAVNVQDAIVMAHVALNNLARCGIPPRNKDEIFFRLGQHLSKAESEADASLMKVA